MPKNILVDLNVILDVLQQRTGYEHSQAILELSTTSNSRVFISGHMVTTFAYLLENSKVPQNKIILHIQWLLDTFTVVSTDQKILKGAVLSDIEDYEDAVIEQAAVACRAEAIITRNTKDFTRSVIPAVLPESYLKLK